MRHDGSDQRAAYAEIRRPHQSHDRGDDEDVIRGQVARQRQRHQRPREQRISRAHHGEQVAVADAVADHAEHRRDQRADIGERGKRRQKHDRFGLDQHIPAENERLHLERPRGEQVGGPLETVIPDAEGCERGRPRRPAHTTMPRFIAFHPCPVSCCLGENHLQSKWLPLSWMQGSCDIAGVNYVPRAGAAREAALLFTRGASFPLITPPKSIPATP